jgi:hypothetical protein
LWLGVASAIYYFVERKGKMVNQTIFKLHLFLSLFVFLDSSYAFLDSYYVGIIITIIRYSLFLLGQIIFIVGVFKAKNKQ